MMPRFVKGFYFKLFRWFCDPDLFEELQGDLEEGYHENVEIYGIKKAAAIYRKEVLLMIRPSVLKIWKSNSKSIHIIMFKNYFKTSIRSLMKNPLSSVINLVGLSAAIGVCIFTYSFVRFTQSTDQFHENKERVFLTTFFADREGKTQQIGTTPRGLAPMLANDFGQLEAVCRIENRNVIVKSGDNTFYEQVTFTDPSYLDMFTFPMKWGTSASLRNDSHVILSERMSVKYFGDENPVGQKVLIKFGGDQKKTFVIGGVAEKLPSEKSFRFNFLSKFENIDLAESNYNFNDWESNLHATLVMVKSSGDIDAIKGEMDKYVTLQNAVNANWKIESFGFEPLSTIHHQTEFIRDDIFFSSHDNYNSFPFLYFISLTLLAIASFNYINIAIVSAANRLKEISMRKVIGASKKMVMIQFLLENIFLTCIAAVLGLIFALSLFIPWFEAMFSFDMGLQMSDLNLYFFLVAVVLFTGVSSGLYPALYVAKFQVISIMKGNLKFGRKNGLTKALLGLQLILASILITIGVGFTSNHDYISQRPWGYNQDEAQYVQVKDRAVFTRLRDVMKKSPHVLSISGSTHHLGKEAVKTIISRPEREYEVEAFYVDDQYVGTLGLNIKEGRNFHKGLDGDETAVLVNEVLVENLGLLEPIGEVLQIDSVRFTIAGVIANFHHRSFYAQIKPMLFLTNKDSPVNYLTLRTQDDKQLDVFVELKSNWRELFPEEPFNGGHQADVWGYYFTDIGNHGQFWRGVSYITVLLAALGLYGLVTLNVSGRMKEFSIRKVLGAHVLSLGRQIVGQYIWLYLIAILIGGVLSYLAIDFLLSFAYLYHRPTNPLWVVFALSVLVFVLIGVVSVQASKLVKGNPATGLRDE